MSMLKITVGILTTCLTMSSSFARSHDEWVKILAKTVASESAFTLNPTIPSPESFLGYELGSNQVTHQELVGYTKKLSEFSLRFSYFEYGHTFEGRPLISVTVSDRGTHASLQESLDHSAIARQQWIMNSSNGELLTKDVPSVAYLAFGVHGNEASPSNAAMLVLYFLAAAQGDWIEGVLDQSIILVDPCLNPDGYDRYVSWLRSNRGQMPSSNPNDREHNEDSPSSRTNHFGFDLNRDWLPATQNETQSRLQIYYRWLPNLVLDVHEMGKSQSLFFQPGIEGRDHPATPPFVRETTLRIAEQFASMLDRANERYFTNQRFDDFYPGKGSTFPDLHGGVGILIEQGSSAGLIHANSEGTRTFAETVANPVRISLTAIGSLQREHRSLMEYQREFYAQSRRGEILSPPKVTPHGYLIRIPGDKRIASEWIRTLTSHRIEMFKLAENIKWQDSEWPANATWVVPLAQPESRYLHAIMDRQKEFSFSIFYDISTWNLADSFGLEWVALDHPVPMSDKVNDVFPEATILHDRSPESPAKSPNKNSVEINSSKCLALAVECNGSIDSMALLQSLTDSKISIRIASIPITCKLLDGGELTFSSGSIFILRADNLNDNKTAEPVLEDWALNVEFLKKTCLDNGFTVTSLQTGLSTSGIDLGSSDLRLFRVPRVGILLDQETNTNSAGSLWYVFDQVFHWPVARIARSQLDAGTFRSLDILILPDQNRWPTSLPDNVDTQSWLLNGGHIIAIAKSIPAVEMLSNQLEVTLRDEEAIAAVKPKITRTDFPELEMAIGELPGVLFRAEVEADSSIELLLGKRDFGKRSFNYIQQGELFAVRPSSELDTRWKPIARLNSSSWLAGFVADTDRTRFDNQVVIAEGLFRDGKITLLTFDPTFRAQTWDGISLLRAMLLAE